MARAAVTAVVVPTSGLNAPTYVTPTGTGAGNGVAVAGADYVLIKNLAAGSTSNVTVKSAQTVDGLAVADRAAIAVLTGTECLIKLAPYELQADGTVYIEFDYVTNVRVLGIR